MYVHKCILGVYVQLLARQADIIIHVNMYIPYNTGVIKSNLFFKKIFSLPFWLNCLKVTGLSGIPLPYPTLALIY